MKASDFITQIQELSHEELVQIDGIGDVIAQNITDFGTSDRAKLMKSDFEKLESEDRGLNIEFEHEGVQSNGKTVVITGTFEQSRGEIKKQLESKGYRVTNSLSKSTDYLLAGAAAGSKLAKAEELGVTVVQQVGQLE